MTTFSRVFLLKRKFGKEWFSNAVTKAVAKSEVLPWKTRKTSQVAKIKVQSDGIWGTKILGGGMQVQNPSRGSGGQSKQEAKRF